MRNLLIATLLVLVSVSVSLAGEAPKAPDGKEVMVAVTKCLQSDIPVSWTGNLMGGKNAVLKEVSVVKVGIYNEREQYWPMKVHVVGSCQLNDPFNKGKKVNFDKIGDFQFSKDDYGEWQAHLAGPGMFQ